MTSSEWPQTFNDTEVKSLSEIGEEEDEREREKVGQRESAADGLIVRADENERERKKEWMRQE